MLRTILTFTLVTFVSLTTAEGLRADIRVNESRNDVKITLEVDHWDDPDELQYAIREGVDLHITEVDGMIRIRSLNDLRVMGRTYYDVNFPSDDVIVEIQSPYSTTLEIEDLDLGRESDDLRVNIYGTLTINNVNAYRLSHSSMHLACYNMSITDSYVRDQLDLDRANNFSMDGSMVGRRIWLDTHSYGNAIINFRNIYIGSYIRLNLTDFNDKVRFNDYVQIDGWTSIYGKGGADSVDIDATTSPMSTLGDGFFDGGSGTDFVYQNQFFFGDHNTNSVEWIK